MPAKILFSHFLITCLLFLTHAGYGQKQQMDFEFPDGVSGYFTVSLLDDAGTEYIHQNRIDLSGQSSKVLTLKIQVFYSKGAQGYAFLLKKSAFTNKPGVLRILDESPKWKRLNQAPITIKFLAQSEGATQIGFDFFYEKDGADEKAGSFVGKTYQIVMSSQTTATSPTERENAPSGSTAAKPKPKPKPAAPSAPADELAFKACDDDNLRCFEEFVRKFPKSSYVEKSKRQIMRLSKLEYEVVKGAENSIFVTLVNAVSPEIDNIIGMISYLDDASLASKFRFEIKPEPGEVVEVQIIDRGKPNRVASLTINLQNLLEANLKEEENIFKFTFGGVDPPYLISLKQDGVLRHKIDVRSLQYEVAYEDLQKELKQLGVGFGAFDVEVYSDKAGNIVRFADQITIESPPTTNPLYYLIALLPLLLIYGLVRIFQNQKRKKFEALKEKRKSEMDHPVEVESTMRETQAPAPAAAPAPASIPPTQPAPPPANKDFDMKIRSVRAGGSQSSTAHMSYEEFEAILHDESCTALEMNVHWTDSAVSRIHLSRKMIFELDRFLRQQNIHEIQEKEGTIPEIGGFLLGQYYQREGENTSEVAILHFVPIHPEDHDVYMLEFSVESLATKLGDVQDEFPQYALVGWFHTHPGHGLFLSKPDMTIQEGFFNKPYQFAMEIDSLSENLDTAFFTRDLNGKVFNSEHRKPESKWFAWTDIEKLTRKRKN